MFSILLSNSDISTEVVPINTGLPALESAVTSSITALYFSRLVLYIRSSLSFLAMGLLVGRGTDIKLSDEVKAAGGLAIIGTERHDSRRVDRQLRGRSGRQGDPGSSQFYVSLEDNLMRLFGSDRVAKVMDRMGLEEGEVIQHSMMTKSIERAQKKVEENNFGIRKRLLEYDDVMNAQREVIYKRRKHALSGERIKLDIANILYDTCEDIVTTNKASGDFKNFEFEIISNFSITAPIDEEAFKEISENEIINQLYDELTAHYNEKIAANAAMAFPVIKDVYERPGNTFERIVVPFTDGVKTLKVVTNLQKAYESEGKHLVQDFERNITLALIDEAWKTHLRKMDELKQSVQLAVHEQKDPLLIYKFEAFELFKAMINSLNKEVLSFLFKGSLPSQSDDQIQEARKRPTGPKNYRTSKIVINKLIIDLIIRVLIVDWAIMGFNLGLYFFLVFILSFVRLDLWVFSRPLSAIRKNRTAIKPDHRAMKSPYWV